MAGNDATKKRRAKAEILAGRSAASLNGRTASVQPLAMRGSARSSLQFPVRHRLIARFAQRITRAACTSQPTNDHRYAGSPVEPEPARSAVARRRPPPSPTCKEPCPPTRCSE